MGGGRLPGTRVPLLKKQGRLLTGQLPERQRRGNSSAQSQRCPGSKAIAEDAIRTPVECRKSEDGKVFARKMPPQGKGVKVASDASSPSARIGIGRSGRPRALSCDATPPAPGLRLRWSFQTQGGVATAFLKDRVLSSPGPFFRVMPGQATTNPHEP